MSGSTQCELQGGTSYIEITIPLLGQSSELLTPQSHHFWNWITATSLHGAVSSIIEFIIFKVLEKYGTHKKYYKSVGYNSAFKFSTRNVHGRMHDVLVNYREHIQ